MLHCILQQTILHVLKIQPTKCLYRGSLYRQVPGSVANNQIEYACITNLSHVYVRSQTRKTALYYKL